MYFAKVLSLAILGFVISLVLNPSAKADPAEPNPFVELYKLRIGINDMNVLRQEALHDLAIARFGRVKALLLKGAVSREDYDISLSDLKVAEAELGLSQKRVLESKAYLQIVEGLVQAKRPIPICTTEME